MERKRKGNQVSDRKGQMKRFLVEKQKQQRPNTLRPLVRPDVRFTHAVDWWCKMSTLIKNKVSFFLPSPLNWETNVIIVIFSASD